MKYILVICRKYMTVLAKEGPEEYDKTVQFKNIPFSVAESRKLDCQFGPKYFKQQLVKRKRLWLQGRVPGRLDAMLKIAEHTPSYQIVAASSELSPMHQLYGCEEFSITWNSETRWYMYSKATLPLTSLSGLNICHRERLYTFQEHLKNLTELGSWGTFRLQVIALIWLFLSAPQILLA